MMKLEHTKPLTLALVAAGSLLCSGVTVAQQRGDQESDRQDRTQRNEDASSMRDQDQNRGQDYDQDDAYGQDRDRRDGSTQGSDRSTRGSQDQGQDNSQNQGQSQDGVAYRLSPDSWIAVGYDFDQDGTYDYVEYLYGYDLIRARAGSQQRAAADRDSMRQGQQGQQGQRGWQGQQGSQNSQNSQNSQGQQAWQDSQRSGSQDRDGWQTSWNQRDRSDARAGRGDSQRDRSGAQQGRSNVREASFGRSGSSSPQQRADQARREGRSSMEPAVYRTTGQIQSTRTMHLIGQDQPHVVATLRTEQGRQAKVDLGPRDGEVSNLQQGDRIEAVGTIGKVDGSAMLMADRVRMNGRTMNVDRPDDLDLQRFEGRVLATRKVDYRQLDNTHVQARVELGQGRTAIVDLGRESKLSDVDLSQGAEIQFLADSIRIGGSPALRAEQIRVNGTLVDLDRRWERERFKRSSSSSQGSQDGWNRNQGGQQQSRGDSGRSDQDWR